MACHRAGFAAGFWALLLVPGVAVAQTADVPPLLPDDPPPLTRRYTAVFERTQPGYETNGYRLGSFQMQPTLNILGGYDDNIFAQSGGAKVADSFVRLQPEVVIRSNWSVHELSLDARGTFDRYASKTSEDVADYLVTASGRYDISGDTSIRAVARAESDHASRSSEDISVQTVRPLAYRVNSALLDVRHDLARFKIDLQGQIVQSRFDDGVLPDGTLYVQRTSDNVDWEGKLKLTYAFTPSFGIFGQAQYDVRTFSIAGANTPKRDSHGYELLAGAVFEPAALMRGEIGIGYVQQNFHNPFYRDISGLSFNGTVSFFPTQLTTVTLSGNRSIKDSGIPSVGGYLSTSVAAEVDHEWLRQLILSASIEYQYNSYRNLDRRDVRIAVRPAVTYRLNRWVELGANYKRLDQRSRGTQGYRPFVDDRAMIELTLRR